MYVVMSGVSEDGFVSGECDGVAADHNLDFCKRSDFFAELRKPGRGVRAVIHKRVFDPPGCPDLADQCLAGVYPDAHRCCPVVLAPEYLVVAGDSSADPSGGLQSVVGLFAVWSGS